MSNTDTHTCAFVSSSLPISAVTLTQIVGIKPVNACEGIQCQKYSTASLSPFLPNYPDRNLRGLDPLLYITPTLRHRLPQQSQLLLKKAQPLTSLSGLHPPPSMFILTECHHQRLCSELGVGSDSVDRVADSSHPPYLHQPLNAPKCPSPGSDGLTRRGVTRWWK